MKMEPYTSRHPVWLLFCLLTLLYGASLVVLSRDLLRSDRQIAQLERSLSVTQRAWIACLGGGAEAVSIAKGQP